MLTKTTPWSFSTNRRLLAVPIKGSDTPSALSLLVARLERKKQRVAGSILPLGPEIEYADEKPAGPIELRIYTGADGEFVLYQHAGDGYDYEHGMHSVIPMHWSESNRTLTIGPREGEYRGMPASLELKVVFVSGAHGTGLEPTANPDKLVVYNGQSISVQAR